jgi:hypothetical protein
MNYLIDEFYVKETCPSISVSTNGITIAAALQIVTLRYMKKLLSTDLFDFYSAYVNAVAPAPFPTPLPAPFPTSPTLTAAKAELFDLVQLYMALQVERHMLTNVVDITNKGATVEQTAATLELITYKRQEIGATILSLEGEIKDYLDSHPADFPEYKPATEAGAFKANRTQNPFGISLAPDRPRVYGTVAGFR